MTSAELLHVAANMTVHFIAIMIYAWIIVLWKNRTNGMVYAAAFLTPPMVVRLAPYAKAYFGTTVRDPC